MLRFAFLLIILLIFSSPVTAQRPWTVTFEGCDASEYIFQISNLRGERLQGRWRAGDRGGAFHLSAGRSITVYASHYFIEVWTNRGDYRLSIPGGDCEFERVDHVVEQPQPAYLVAAIGVSGPALWECQGHLMVNDDGTLILTASEDFVWHGDVVPVTVLILGEDIDPADCTVMGAAPHQGYASQTWYVDHARWTCIAYQGHDAGCGGRTDFH